MLNQTYQLLDAETNQIEAVLVMAFATIALLFVPFPRYPLHASQAGPQKPSIIQASLVWDCYSLGFGRNHETEVKTWSDERRACVSGG